MMTPEERRTLRWTTGLLLLSSLVRLGWEARPRPPIFPEEAVPAALLEESRAAAAREERMATPLAEGERIDPNRDPEEELARLPGVGPALAQRIIAGRNEGGGYRVPTDLLEVSGIGPATLARIEPHLDFSEPPPPSPSSARRAPGSPALAPGSPPSAALGVGPPSPGAAEGRVDVNRAGAAELDGLPGIGPVLAERILEHRGRVGPFSRPEDLLEVPGIGPAVLARLLPLIRAGG